MEMQIDSWYVKTQREQRAWSQEHLAEVTGLGLRTIQRIESTGIASYESARALAAVFEVDVTRLRDTRSRPDDVPRISVPLRPLLGALAALVMGAAVLVATRSFADQVLMDISVTRNTPIPGSTAVDSSEWITQLVVAEGALVPGVNDSRVAGIRFTIVPKLLADGNILLEMQIFERRGDDDVLLTSPRLVTHDGEKAEVVTGDDARSFRFAITPRRYSPPLL